MYNLVKSEFFKLKHNPVFLFVSCLMTISLIGHIINSMYYIHLSIKLGWEKSNSLYDGITCFICNLTPANSLLIINIVLISMFICYDFEHRITQAQISSGCNKLKMFISKISVIFLAASIIMMLYTFIYTISISIFYKFGTEFTIITFERMILNYLFSLLIHTGLLSFIITFSYLFKKSGIAVAANAFSFIFINAFLDKMSTNQPLLNKFMTFRMFNSDLTLNFTQNELIIVILSCLAFIILNLFISYYIFKHSELK